MRNTMIRRTLMKIAALVLAVLGALAVYLSKKLFMAIKKREPDDLENVKVKLCGFAVAVCGILLLLLSDRI